MGWVGVRKVEVGSSRLACFGGASYQLVVVVVVVVVPERRYRTASFPQTILVHAEQQQTDTLKARQTVGRWWTHTRLRPSILLLCPNTSKPVASSWAAP